jgi:hypothetical protein
LTNHVVYKIDIDELIFARKNRAYGAYQLRKAYKKSLAAAMWIAILIFILVTTGPFVYKMINPGKDRATNNEKVIITELAPPPSIGEKKETIPVETPAMSELVKDGADFFYNLSEFEGDTPEPEQTYIESTLNVTLKYPNGWTYIDQNVKNKLDGVTFWLVQGDYRPPPYIHLEVKEKYLFNPARFKYKMELNGNTAYYNDPEELEGQVSQVVYIRTDSDEDYSLKLIMKGRDEFKSFQPVFFNIIKSFRFGESFF